jgi:hypothetical protein
MSADKTTDILDRIADLHKQATTERSHHYVASTLDACANEIEHLRDALWQIAQWADAYPLEVFPKVTEDYAMRAHEVLTANGMTLDRLSAHAMRHVVQGVGKIAKEALNGQS